MVGYAIDGGRLVEIRVTLRLDVDIILMNWYWHWIAPNATVWVAWNLELEINVDAKGYLLHLCLLTLHTEP